MLGIVGTQFKTFSSSYHHQTLIGNQHINEGLCHHSKKKKALSPKEFVFSINARKELGYSEIGQTPSPFVLLIVPKEQIQQKTLIKVTTSRKVCDKCQDQGFPRPVRDGLISVLFTMKVGLLLA